MRYYDISMKIGVFDSGIGGEAIAHALKATFPQATIVTVNDSAHVPYGTKTKHEVIALTDAAIQPLLRSSCDVVVIACNTATAFGIEYLRATYPTQSFIGIEPMVKTAAQLTTTGKIAVFATTSTLSSERYAALKQRYADALSVLEPDCSDWARLIENNAINRSHIQAVVEEVCDAGADVIVLGCTHYHWIKETIVGMSEGRAQVIEPSEAIGHRVAAVMSALG